MKAIATAVAAAALALGAASAADAATIDLSYDLGGLFQNSFGSGSLTTSADEGTFSLGAGITGFSFDVTSYSIPFGGTAYLGLSDLASLSVTIASGAITAFSFATNDFEVPINFLGVFPTGDSDIESLSATGLGRGELTFNSANAGTYTGKLHAKVKLDDCTPAVPEPASWAMMIGGIGASGAGLRRARRRAPALAAA